MAGEAAIAAMAAQAQASAMLAGSRLIARWDGWFTVIPLGSQAKGTRSAGKSGRASPRLSAWRERTG
jgi:hypothetical protein